jgi:hypothetical protein
LETGSSDIDAVLKHHHDMQEQLAEQFLNLAKNLKENATAAGSVIKEDKQVSKHRFIFAHSIHNFVFVPSLLTHLATFL